jgi:hypothetical protein
MRKAMVLGVLGLAGTLAAPAFADEFSGWRLTGTIGQETINSKLTYTPFAATEDANTNRFVYGFGTGWALNKYLAFEVGLRGGSTFNSDHFESRMTATPENFISQSTELMGLEGSVIGTVWLNPHISFFGRLGMFGWDATESLSVGNVATDVRPASKVVTSVEEHGFDALFGVGFQTQLDGALVRFEYRMSEFGDIASPGLFNKHDNKLSSIDFSIVWVLH